MTPYARSSSFSMVLWLAALTCSGCFAEPPIAGSAGTTGDESETPTTSTTSTTSEVEESSRGSTTGESTASESTSSEAESQDASSSTESDDGADATGDADGSSTGGDPSQWSPMCRTDPQTGACPFPVVGSESCYGGPTVSLPDVGCGGGAETRVTLNLSEPGDFIVGLIMTEGQQPNPDTTLTIIGQSGAAVVACQGTVAGATGPIAEVDLSASNYDVVVTTPSSGVAFPLVVRPVDSLCEVPVDCCEPGMTEQCPDMGLRDCVGELDAYCANEAWDQRCINIGIAACGAACAVGAEG